MMLQNTLINVPTPVQSAYASSGKSSVTEKKAQVPGPHALGTLPQFCKLSGKRGYMEGYRGLIYSKRAQRLAIVALKVTGLTVSTLNSCSITIHFHYAFSTAISEGKKKSYFAIYYWNMNMMAKQEQKCNIYLMMGHSAHFYKESQRMPSLTPSLSISPSLPACVWELHEKLHSKSKHLALDSLPVKGQHCIIFPGTGTQRLSSGFYLISI